MEKYTIIIGLITAVISLVAALMPLIINPKSTSGNSITINGKKNTANQSNSINLHHHTYVTIESKHDTYISTTGTSSSTNEDNSVLAIFGIVVMLVALYKNRVILQQVLWLPLLASAILSVILCVFLIDGKSITLVHPSQLVKILFMLTPVFVSLLFSIQNFCFFSEVEPTELWQKMQVATAILCNYLGILLLLIAQISTLCAHHIRHKKIRKKVLAFARMWPAAIILPIVPFILWLLNKTAGSYS